MSTKRDYITSVEHTNSIMSYTQRGVSRSQALQYAILKYPNAKYIHVLGA